MKQYVLGIDQGTTGTLAGLMNAEGEVMARADKPHRQIYPQATWVEQDPLELWLNACELVNRVLAESRVRADELAGIGIANQGESVMAWDRETGRPLYNVLVWQDTRSQALIEKLIEKLAEDQNVAQEVVARTGLRLDSYFSAGKMRWLLDNVPDAKALQRSGRLCFGTLDTWLIWNMTQRASFVTDVSTASRTLLLNIHTLDWDPWLLRLFDIPVDVLPKVMPSTAFFGDVCHPALNCTGTPILASLVDQPAAMVSHACLRAGQIKATYGTGCFINLNTGSQPVVSSRGLLTMLAWQRDGIATYGLDGGVFTAAAAVNWLKDGVGLIGSAAAVDDLCAAVSDSGGVTWVPAQIGLGAPFWDRSVRAAWLGIGIDTTREHLVRAVLEGIALRVVQVIQAMVADTQLDIDALRVDGGLTGSQTLMQIQADLSGYPVEVLQDLEATLCGVCYLAARQSQLWDSDDRIGRHVHVARTYEPSIGADQRIARLAEFERAIALLQQWHKT